MYGNIDVERTGILDMEQLGIAAKRKPAKVIDFAQYIENNRGTND